jgi:hypothetical protein
VVVCKVMQHLSHTHTHTYTHTHTHVCIRSLEEETLIALREMMRPESWTLASKQAPDARGSSGGGVAVGLEEFQVYMFQSIYVYIPGLCIDVCVYLIHTYVCMSHVRRYVHIHDMTTTETSPECLQFKSTPPLPPFSPSPPAHTFIYACTYAGVTSRLR